MLAFMTYKFGSFNLTNEIRWIVVIAICVFFGKPLLEGLDVIGSALHKKLRAKFSQRMTQAIGIMLSLGLVGLGAYGMSSFLDSEEVEASTSFKNHVPEDHIEAQAEEFCMQMSYEPVCERWDNLEVEAYTVLDCIPSHPLSFTEDSVAPLLIPTCLSDVDAQAFAKIDTMVNWGDNNFQSHRAQRLRDWARNLDATGCEHATSELTSLRCVLHADAMAYIPAN